MVMVVVGSYHLRGRQGYRWETSFLVPTNVGIVYLYHRGSRFPKERPVIFSRLKRRKSQKGGYCVG